MSGLPKRSEDKTNTFGIVLIGVSSAILLWATIVLLQAYYENTAGPLEARRSAMAKSQKVRDLRARQQAAMRDIKWVDPAAKLVSLPIEDAMRMVVDELRADPRASLVPAVGAHDQPTIPGVAGRPPDPSGAEVEEEADPDDLPEPPEDQEVDERGATDEDETAALDEDPDDEDPDDDDGEDAP
jgi:hypothetical protein